VINKKSGMKAIQFTHFMPDSYLELLTAA